MDRFSYIKNIAGLPQLVGRRKSAFNSFLFILIAIALGLFFAYFSSEVAEGDSQAFDLIVVQYAKELRASHRWLAEVLRDLSGLGSAAVLTLITVGCVFYQALFSSRVTAALVALSVSTGTLMASNVRPCLLNDRHLHCEYTRSTQ